MAFSTRRCRGAVLVLVLGAVAILAVLAVELSRRASAEAVRAVRVGREAAFRRTFSSGMEIAKGLLAEGRTNESFDSLGQAWNRKVETELQPGVLVAVHMADESGKLNVLKAAGDGPDATRMRKCLARLFAYLQKTEPEREQEWKAAEAAVRQRLGITDEKSGSAATNNPPQLYTLDGLRETGVPLDLVFGANNTAGDTPRWALCDVLTVFGDGRVNLNTARSPVLYALDEEYDETLVGRIEAWRGTHAKDGASEASGKAFHEPKDLELVEGIVKRATINGQSQIVKNLYTKVQEIVSVQGKCFSARIEAVLDGRRRVAWGFFETPKAAQTGGAPQPGMRLTAYEEIEP